MRSNSGNTAPTGCTTACAIARVVAIGFSSACLLNAAEIDVPRTLKGIEDRYNRTQTLQLSFTESYKLQGRSRVEKGELFLRKPGRMRWQYSSPAGKLFLSDGKWIYTILPDSNRIQKMKAKLGARSKTELIARAIRSGLIAPAEEDLTAVRSAEAVRQFSPAPVPHIRGTGPRRA